MASNGLASFNSSRKGLMELPCFVSPELSFPQPGFRPAERVEETGRRLKGYWERFNVPFEYNAIAHKWETIKLEDFRIDRDEIIVVNCLNRMKNLPDDTVMASNRLRDAVLDLIRRILPDIFIHGVVNGTHSAPFFLTRFREALFYFSSFYDMFEARVPREDEGRMLIEWEMFGNDAMNAIAYEGTERVERPETYKQWRVRNLRAGFRQLPLDQESLKKAKAMVKSIYHQDFVVDEDGQWSLQGWKGKILQALLSGNLSRIVKSGPLITPWDLSSSNTMIISAKDPEDLDSLDIRLSGWLFSF